MSKVNNIVADVKYRPKQTSIILDRPVLKQQYLTPTDVNLPRYVDKSIKSLHRGVPIKENNFKTTSSENLRSELDGFYLLESTGMGFPEDAQQVTLSDRKLSSTVADDFTFFTELLYIDVSENFLSLEPFGAFPKLRELRMACNHISGFTDNGGELFGFENLMYLDLAYNQLTPNAVQQLEVLSSLKELDLSGNNLKSLSINFSRFLSLEKLMLDYNQLGDETVFDTLSTAPNIRQVSLANNFLSRIPPEACSNGLRLLEYLDISFNYFPDESSIESLVYLPRIVTLLLYGNPVLGPTGEDPLFVYIEGLMERAGDYRDQQKSTLPDIEFLTEIPRKRSLKKGQALGRQAMYRDFAVVQVDTSISNRTTKEWRKRGADTLFAEAMQHKKTQHVAPSSSHIPDLTFLTSTNQNGGTDFGELDRNTDAIADDVMQRVAAEMGILNSAELLLMRDRVKIPLRASNQITQRLNEQQQQLNHKEFYELTAVRDAYDDGDGDYYNQQQLQQQMMENADRIPSDVFVRQISDPIATNAQPVALKTAMKALSLALKQPLTDYNEVPSKFSLNSKEYVRQTANSRNRQLPRRVSTLAASAGGDSQLADEDNHNADMAINKYARKGLAEPLALKQMRQEQRKYTLTQIDQVLDSLNSNTQQFTNSRGGVNGANNDDNSNSDIPNAALAAAGAAANAAMTKDTMNAMRYFARPYRGIKSLMDMVDEVTEEFTNR